MKDETMKEKGCLFFDFDGTLTVIEDIVTPDGKQTAKPIIPQENFDALLEAKERGYQLFLCTGRAKGSLKNAFARYPLLKDIPWDGMICGASDMWYHGNRIAITYFSEEECMKWIDYSIKTKSEFHYNGTESWENLKFQMMDDENEIEAIKAQVREWLVTNPMTNCAVVPTVDFKFAPNSRATVINMPTYSDIFAEGCNKGIAIRKFCNLIGVPIEQTVCFGDSGNDIEMFRACPTSVCMACSPEELKALSAFVAKGKYGVAEGIRWLLDVKS